MTGAQVVVPTIYTPTMYTPTIYTYEVVTSTYYTNGFITGVTTPTWAYNRENTAVPVENHEISIEWITGVPQPIPQPLPEKCNTGGQQQPLGPLQIKEGTFKYYYATDDNGNVIYDVYSDQDSTQNGEGVDNVVSYNYSSINGVVLSNFSNTDIVENSESEVQISGCQGWWDNDNVDISNVQNGDTESFMKNCFVFDPVTGEKCAASSVNFSTLRGQSMQFGNWVCNTQQGDYTFDFDTCQWTPVNGDQTLVSIKALIRAPKEMKQNYLGF